MVGQFIITTKMGEERYGGQNIISNRMVFFFLSPFSSMDKAVDHLRMIAMNEMR